MSATPPRRYFDYVNFNATGYRPYVTTLYAVLLGCARKTISRVLVLIVSMGYGVVLPYLGAIQYKVFSCCWMQPCSSCCPLWLLQPCMQAVLHALYMRCLSRPGLA